MIELVSREKQKCIRFSLKILVGKLKVKRFLLSLRASLLFKANKRCGRGESLSCEAIYYWWWQDWNYETQRKDLLKVNFSLLSVWHYGTRMTFLNKTFLT